MQAQLTNKQAEAYLSKARYKVLNFGRRSGKTTELAWEAKSTAWTKENGKITYFAQTFGDARDIAWEIFLEILNEIVIKKNETLLEITVRNQFGGTSKISLKGWESVVTGEKGRGTENDLLLLDEVAHLRGFRSLWEKVLEPTLLTTKGRAVFSSTPNGFNDFYELANKAQTDKNWFYLHATSYDNPYNSVEDLEEKKRTLPSDTFAQEYLADFRKQEGLVFKEFSREKNVFENKEQITILTLGGIDFGYTNPAAIIRVDKDKHGNYWVMSEWYKTGKTDAQLAEIAATFNFNKVYPDPENPGGIQELKNRQINVQEVIKGKDSIKTGINKMRELLAQRRLKIHKSCSNLLWEIETYKYDEKKANKDENELPIHENCHAIDALRYVILMDYQTKKEITPQFYPKLSKPRTNIAL